MTAAALRQTPPALRLHSGFAGYVFYKFFTEHFYGITAGTLFIVLRSGRCCGLMTRLMRRKGHAGAVSNLKEGGLALAPNLFWPSCHGPMIDAAFGSSRERFSASKIGPQRHLNGHDDWPALGDLFQCSVRITAEIADRPARIPERSLT